MSPSILHFGVSTLTLVWPWCVTHLPKSVPSLEIWGQSELSHGISMEIKYKDVYNLLDTVSGTEINKWSLCSVVIHLLIGRPFRVARFTPSCSPGENGIKECGEVPFFRALLLLHYSLGTDLF